MQGRSWMAALTLVLSVGSMGAAAADGPKTPAPAPAKAATKPVAKRESNAKKEAETYVVRLDLNIAGLNQKGCDIEIKPASGGCKFKAVTQHVDATGKTSIKFKDVETESADRDCTFAITIREPGQTEKTVKRGLRLKSPGNPGQSLDCFISSPSKVAAAEQRRAAKR